MTGKEFSDLLQRRLNLTVSVLDNKAVEYATGSDRLHNFKQAAAMLRCTPAQACLGFMTKHLVSVFDMVETFPGTPTVEKIDEKIGDAINYLILLEALLKEQKE